MSNNPFLGLGFNSWTQKFSRVAQIAQQIGTFLQYLTTPNTSSFTLRSTGTVNYRVDWGDGSVETLTTTSPTHTYSSPGQYTIKINPEEGSIYRPYFNNQVSDTSIAEVSFPGGSGTLGSTLSNAWNGASNMTSFGEVDTSSGTDFSSAWYDCSSLTTFPANMFDTTGTLLSYAFNSAWTKCALTAQSIENILTSLDINGASNITLHINIGTNASKSTWSTSANDAYDNLIAKGWTISYNL